MACFIHIFTQEIDITAGSLHVHGGDTRQGLFDLIANESGKVTRNLKRPPLRGDGRMCPEIHDDGEWLSAYRFHLQRGDRRID